IGRERKGDERMAEEPAPELDQRQHAGHLAVALREQVVRRVPEDLLVNLAPADAVEEAGLRTALDEALPAIRVFISERANVERQSVRGKRKWSVGELHCNCAP